MKYKFGDIFEIKTNKGLAYIQYVNEYTDPPYYGSLIRILDGIFSERPTSFADLVSKSELFYCFAPLMYKNQQKYFKKIGNEPVPKKFKTFPPFRMAGLNRDWDTGIVNDDWWIWENGVETKVGPINDRIKKIENLGATNLKAVKNAIERGYLPEKSIQILGKAKGINIED